MPLQCGDNIIKMNTVEQLKEAFERFLEENQKFVEKGNKAAGGRARKALMEMAKLAKARRAEILEVVAIRVRIEAGIGEPLAGQCRDLAVLHVVLQKLRNLLAAKILAVAPRIDQNAQTDLMCLIDDPRNIRPPEIEIEFGDGENHLRDTMRLHFLEVRLGMFHVVKSIVTDSSLSNHV